MIRQLYFQAFLLPRVICLATVLLGLGWVAGPSAGQSVDPYIPPEPAVAPARIMPPLRLAATADPVAVLAPSDEEAVEQIRAVRTWNQSGRRPARIGFVRPLPQPSLIRFAPETSAAPYSTTRPLDEGGAWVQQIDGSRVWGGEVRVEGAHRLRLHLSDLRLPEGTRFWVYGEEGEPVGPFGLELAHENALWTPSVTGPAVRLEIELPATSDDGDWGLLIDQVGELLPPSVAFVQGSQGSGPVDTSCLIDVQCVTDSTFPMVDLAERAIAHLQFPSDPGFFGVCTGGLLNDTASSGTPFLLTANHCFSRQSNASGLEAFWDLLPPVCGGTPTSFAAAPRSNGAILLATGVTSDYTLVRLNRIPGGRAFLGWNANPAVLQQSTVLHRVSHPAPGDSIFAQAYTRTQYLPSNFNRCGSNGGRDLVLWPAISVTYWVRFMRPAAESAPVCRAC